MTPRFGNSAGSSLTNSSNVALKQVAVTNALLSKKKKVETRREQILNEVNTLVAERRYLESKIRFLDNLLRTRGHGRSELPSEPGPTPEPEAEMPGTDPEPPAGVPTPPAEPSVFAEKDFGVQDFLTMMNEMDPKANFSFDTAWRLCNEFLNKKIIRISSRKMTDKGMVRRFMAVK
jgi:hypothetical protein